MTKTVLITGANGEIGHGLIHHLAEAGGVDIVAMDLQPLDPALASRCARAVVGDILNTELLESLSAAYHFAAVYHLAALLSTRAERQPILAHRVNIDGTLNLLEIAVTQSRMQGRALTFLYPSSIAVYGLPDLAAKVRAGAVREADWCTPRTMYGINKLYCEQLGRYYTHYYRQLDLEPGMRRVDFRCLRFPGLISAATLPAGGTSDFGPEMLHAAARGEAYAAFVREDTRIPFMAMPDAVRALLALEAAPAASLTQQTYNVRAFNPSAGEFGERVRHAFPAARTTWAPDLKRQAILDSWPADVDDGAAARDWGWRPGFDLAGALDDYLLPAVRRRYGAR